MHCEMRRKCEVAIELLDHAVDCVCSWWNTSGVADSAQNVGERGKMDKYERMIWGHN